MSGSTAAHQLEKLIADIETDLGIDANTPIGQKVETSAPAAPVAAPAAPTPAAEQKPKAAKKEKAPKAPKPAKKAAAPAADQPEITKLDIRVGKIVKVWKHDTADKYVSLACVFSSQVTACCIHTRSARTTD